MKRLTFKGSDIENTFTERALDALYAFHAFVTGQEKKKKKRIRNKSNQSRWRDRHQVSGH